MHAARKQTLQNALCHHNTRRRRNADTTSKNICKPIEPGGIRQETPPTSEGRKNENITPQGPTPPAKLRRTQFQTTKSEQEETEPWKPNLSYTRIQKIAQEAPYRNPEPRKFYQYKSHRQQGVYGCRLRLPDPNKQGHNNPDYRQCE